VADPQVEPKGCVADPQVKPKGCVADPQVKPKGCVADPQVKPKGCAADPQEKFAAELRGLLSHFEGASLDLVSSAIFLQNLMKGQTMESANSPVQSHLEDLRLADVWVALPQHLRTT
jgi:hypothetical protein